jgi:hypothetical protein
MTQADGSMYIDWMVTQRTYIKYIVPLFDEHAQHVSAGYEFIPDEVVVQVRFVFWDPTNDSKKYYDEVEIKIESSTETLSNLCNWSQLTVDGQISGTKNFDVIKSDSTTNRKRANFYVPSILTNFDALDEECQDKIEMTLETYNGEAWEVLAWGINEDYVEGEQYDEEFLLYRDATGGVYASVSFDEDYFIDVISFIHRDQSDSSKIDVPMRVAWRDDDGNPVTFTGITNEFTLHVEADLGSENDCSSAVLTFKSGANDKTLTFKNATASGWNAADISFDNALTVEMSSTDGSILPSTCYYRFALYVWDKNSGLAGEWKTLQGMLDTLRNEKPNFSSEISFDSTSANLRGTFLQEDIEALTDRLTEAGKTQLKFKVDAFIPRGPTVDDANLIS